MEDYIVRAMTLDGSIRAFFAYTKNTVDKAREIHNLSPAAAAALGRTLTAISIMSCFLKGDRDTVTIQINGDGPLGSIVAVTDAYSNVRGYVHNNEVETVMINPTKIDVGAAVGKNGYINVIKDFGLKEPYIGFVNLVSGEIAEDLTYYFANSEQTPSSIGLGVLIEHNGQISESGGYIIQLMPNTKSDVIENLEMKLSTLKSVTTLLKEGETPESILKNILGDIGMEIIETRPCNYKCNCSRDRMESNLIILGSKELNEIIQEVGEAELQCHFCNTKYMFCKEDLINILNYCESI